MSYSYKQVLIYSAEGEFLGFTIMGPHKLQTTNIYPESDIEQLQKRLAELNADADLKKFWPHPQDPDVVEILDNPEFFPIEYTQVQVVDDDRSNYVWQKVQHVDENGNPVFESGKPVMVDGEKLDEAASVIIYKMATVPKNPSDMMLRIKAASEVVAKRRAQSESIQ